jgi:hypothetical protein
MREGRPQMEEKNGLGIITKKTCCVVNCKTTEEDYEYCGKQGINTVFGVIYFCGICFKKIQEGGK